MPKILASEYSISPLQCPASSLEASHRIGRQEAVKNARSSQNLFGLMSQGCLKDAISGLGLRSARSNLCYTESNVLQLPALADISEEEKYPILYSLNMRSGKQPKKTNIISCPCRPVHPCSSPIVLFAGGDILPEPISTTSCVPGRSCAFDRCLGDEAPEYSSKGPLLMVVSRLEYSVGVPRLWSFPGG